MAQNRVPSATQFAEALRVNAKESDKPLLKFHYAAPQRTVSASELTHLLDDGPKQSTAVNSKYGHLAARVGDALGFTPGSHRRDTLVTTDHRRGDRRWVLRPEVAQALELLGWVKPTSTLPDTACDLGKPPRRIDATVRRIVRDTKAARDLKRKCEHACQLCGLVLMLFDRPYSEAHHLKPLGEPYGGDDDRRNMLVVCPNCHAMLDFGAVRIESTAVRNSDKHLPAQKYIDYHNEHICRLPKGL